MVCGDNQVLVFLGISINLRLKDYLSDGRFMATKVMQEVAINKIRLLA